MKDIFDWKDGRIFEGTDETSKFPRIYHSWNRMLISVSLINKFLMWLISRKK